MFASLVVPLVLLAPRAWPLLAVLGFVMAARLATGAHFLSDVLGGVALVLWITCGALALVKPSAIAKRGRDERSPAT
jgi:membrane-associated phospholipid phosphatase